MNPHDPLKCIKVLRTDERRTVRMPKDGRIIPSVLLPIYDNNVDEMRELDALERRLGAETMVRHLPRAYGMARTDMGAGLVLDLMRDHDGKISRSLRELIVMGYDLSSLRGAFDEFGSFLLDHLVLTRKLLDHNIAVRMNGDGTKTFFLIDGLGDRSWMRFFRSRPGLAKAKIRQRVETAWPRFEALAATGGISEEARRKSSWGEGMLAHRG